MSSEDQDTLSEFAAMLARKNKERNS
jgi:hypothetical protein